MKRLAKTPLEELWAVLSHKQGKPMNFPSDHFMRESILSAMDSLLKGEMK